MPTATEIQEMNDRVNTQIASDKLEMDKNPLLYYRVPVEWEGKVNVIAFTKLDYYNGSVCEFAIVVPLNPDGSRSGDAAFIPVAMFPTRPDDDAVIWNLKIQLTVAPSPGCPNPIPWGPLPYITVTPA